MAKYTYEIDAIVSIDADSDEEALKIFERVNAECKHGPIFTMGDFARTDTETSETEWSNWRHVRKERE